MRKSILLQLIISSLVITSISSQTFRDQFEGIWGELELIEYNNCSVYYKEGTLKLVDKTLKESNWYNYIDLATFDKNKTRYTISWVQSN